GGPARARNVGIQDSRGEIIFFGECDCVYDSDYLEKAVQALEKDPAAGAVCLTGAPLVLKNTLGTACLEVENKVQHRLLREGKIRPFYAWVYTRDALEKVGGFDQKLFQAEDKDLFQRVTKAGYHIAWVPGINWRHKREETMQKLAMEWFIRGRTRILYVLKHGQTLDLMKSLAPLWLFIIGFAVISTLSTLIGLALVIISLGIPALYSFRVIRASWPEVPKKGIYLWYPMFVLIRNFDLAFGYSYGLFRIFVRKIQRKPVSWQTI
ncbi:MAG: glycosyltransferase family 2 protein, partial [Rhabdochlamydiaceae bacterium]